MNSLMDKVVQHLDSDIFTDTALRHLIKGTNDRRYGLVKRALKAGDLIHLRRGLYALPKRYQRRSCNLYEIAQKIYGPSYISFESALSYHQWILEAVYTVTSACSKRSKEIKTPLGVFSYTHIPSNQFFVGVQRISASDGDFFMATPWRALVDLIYIQKKDWKGLKPVIESLRIDKNQLQDVDFRLFEELRQATGSMRVKKFIDSVKKELLP